MEITLLSLSWYFFALFLGKAIVLVEDLIQVQARKKDFSFKFWISRNYLSLLFSMLTSVALFMLFFDEGILDTKLSMLIGYASEKLWKQTMETRRKAFESK